MKLLRYADRPDLREIRLERLSMRTFPVFMHHNQGGARYWGRLYEEHPDFQLALVDGDELVAELHSVPLAWDSSLADLPVGWDDVFTRAFESGRPADALAALAISVAPERQGMHLSTRMIEAMRDAGRALGLRFLIAPVRPTAKEHYPLIPIERYMGWRRADGSHFDPWLRIHERVGGELVAPAPDVDGVPGAGRGLGGVDGHGDPGRRRPRRARDARAARRARRRRPSRRAERLGRPPDVASSAAPRA